MKLQIQIHGAREVFQAMQELPRKLDRKLLNKSLLVGAVLTRDAARRLAPILQTSTPRRRVGTLRRAIRAVPVRPRGHTASVWVRVRPLTRRQILRFKQKGKSAAENPNDPFYWRFVEFGTSKMAARPFMRPAFEQTKFRAVNEIIRDSKERVQSEVAKLGQAQRFRNRLSRLTGVSI